jgi:ABC-type polysaccharide/polyol phosphate export permease
MAPLSSISVPPSVQRYWEILNVLVPKNLKVRYRGSFLGVYWSLLNPLIMTGVYTVLFGGTFVRDYPDYDRSIVKYMLSAFTGLVILNFFSTSTSQALISVVANGSLLNKVRLPVSIFPVSMVAANLFQFAVGSLPLLIIVTMVTSGDPLSLLLLFIPILALVLVSTGVGFLVSGLYVFFRDLPYFYELIVFLLWISTPIFYPVSIISPKVRPLLAINPLFPITESIKQIALNHSFDLGLTATALLSGIIVFTTGLCCFHWWRGQFMDLL